MAIAFGFYMAWSIGANDAANAMGTSVGSKAVSFREAVIIAAIFEFAGAMIAGGGVADTMRSGIVDPALFADPTLFPAGNGAELFIWGMMASLISAALWLHIAAYLGWPVSTTHSIVGAITGFGAVSVGIANVEWLKLLTIAASWLTSPLLGGVLSFIIFLVIRKAILDAKNANLGLRLVSPILAMPVFMTLTLVLFTKGLKKLHGTFAEYGIGNIEMIGISALVGVLSSLVLAFAIRKIHIAADESSESKYAKIEKVFRYLQVITACFVAFAHGSNDVANSIGPVAAIVGTLETMDMTAGKVPIPSWVLLLGAVGIVVGLATYGYRVIETIGTKITEITPTRGFAAEFGAASTILIGSHFGIPLSTTHTVVGSVIGVGFARGMNALNLKIIINILKSWLYTIPFCGILTIILYYLFTAIFV
ncbi:inorganic phosphate transporter [Microvenator marinus]|uniref:Phosphate transporter n=2 Tax=Microvenator marinus TaxID=2600177 RepID=A0A5B8XYB7_9DELT|nr:inorganic phosphate transporter [Microvenator marinus]